MLCKTFSPFYDALIILKHKLLPLFCPPFPVYAQPNANTIFLNSSLHTNESPTKNPTSDTPSSAIFGSTRPPASDFPGLGVAVAV